MKIIDIEQRSPEWFEARKGVITGSEVAKVVGGKVGADSYFYEKLAERLTIGTHEDENAMDRGTRLEDEARAKYTEISSNKTKNIGIIISDENQYIGSSPDAYVDKKVLDHAVEIKCLSSGKHIRAYIEKEIPKDYKPQTIQYFIANEKLKKLDVFFYDPRLYKKVSAFIITINRKDIEDEIVFQRDAQIQFIKRIEESLDIIMDF